VPSNGLVRTSLNDRNVILKVRFEHVYKSFTYVSFSQLSHIIRIIYFYVLIDIIKRAFEILIEIFQALILTKILNFDRKLIKLVKIKLEFLKNLV
jgi:hypothetical protein